MDKQESHLFFQLNNFGQSSVEYILLLLVVVFLGMTVINSSRFKEFFGESSPFFTKVAKQVEYSYRHGRLGTEDEINSDDYDLNKKHDTYQKLDTGGSRFFLPKAKYPEN